MKKIMILLILFFIPQLVSAGIISLRTTVSTDTLTEDMTKINVEISNLGDESAYDVEISSMTDDFRTDKTYLKELRPNEPFKAILNATIKKTLTEGKYPVVVFVDYADANGYHFSSVSPTFIVYNIQTISKISGLIPEISLSGRESKKLILSVRNLDDEEHNVDVKLILPRELKVVDGEKEISIESKQEKSLDFEVSSLSAISGSTYAILASMEYEDDIHYSSFANGIIRINGETTSKQESEGTSILAYVILFISIIFILIYAYPKYIKRGKKVEKKKNR